MRISFSYLPSESPRFQSWDETSVTLATAYIAAKGDPIADLYEDIAAEEKARATYQWIIGLSDDSDLNDGLKLFIRNASVRPWIW